MKLRIFSWYASSFSARLLSLSLSAFASSGVSLKDSGEYFSRSSFFLSSARRRRQEERAPGKVFSRILQADARRSESAQRQAQQPRGKARSVPRENAQFHGAPLRPLRAEHGRARAQDAGELPTLSGAARPPERPDRAAQDEAPAGSPRPGPSKPDGDARAHEPPARGREFSQEPAEHAGRRRR